MRRAPSGRSELQTSIPGVTGTVSATHRARSASGCGLQDMQGHGDAQGTFVAEQQLWCRTTALYIQEAHWKYTEKPKRLGADSSCGQLTLEAGGQQTHLPLAVLPVF